MNRKSDRPSVSCSSRRQAARRLLERLLRPTSQQSDPQRGRLMLESLEARQMLAGDVDLWATDPQADRPLESPSEAGAFSTIGLQAEGEAANDLVAFAQALTQAGVTYYGAAWCSFCTEQRELFGDGGEELPFVEVTNPDRTLNEIGQNENITSFPTWEFPDNTRATGVLSLEELSQRAGIAIPQSDQPIIAPIGNQTVEIGSPLHIPVDAYDPDSPELTVTVSVADPSLLEATVLQNNRSARINVNDWGSMTFELFEDRAPRPTGRFIELAQSGFFDESDTNSVPFHRVIDDFVLQGGDPTGTGSGGSNLGDFDDQYHPDLQHNRSGILSYAKSLDDTNDSQFFITEGQQRHLDYNHSIFGQLVEGESIREAISETATTNTRPDFDVIIDSVEIFQDTENSVVMLKPTGSGTGETEVTITVSDPDGHTFTEVITVSVEGDQENANPYLADIAPVSTAGGSPATFTLEGIDVEGDPIAYEARVIDNSGATATVDQATGDVTVTPPDGFSGDIRVEVAARKPSTPTSNNPSTRSSTMDLQVVPVSVGPQAPTGITLDASSDTGLSDSDGITNTAPITFTVTGVVDGATVEVLAGDTQIGVGTASGTTATVTTNNFAALGNATHIVSARQTVAGQTSSRSSTITVTYDTVAPGPLSDIADQATAGEAFLANVQNDDEGSGLRYALVSAPAGMTIGAEDGVINWTPTSSQTGDQSFTVRATDVAGNATERQYTVNVGAEPLVSVRLEITDLDGNVLNQLTPNQEFEVRVYGNDERLFGEAQGIFALYLDVLFDAELAEPSPFTPPASGADPDPEPTIFTFDDTYDSGTHGVVGDGILDEVGSFSSTSSFLGPGERFFFSARMRATNPGTLVVTTDPAEGSGREIALFNIDDAISADRVNYGSASIDIAANFALSDDTVSVDEDSTDNDIDVLANDSALAEGTTLTIVSVSDTSAQGGAVSINGSRVRYTPAANFNGIDTFTYTVADQDGNQQTATVTATVRPVNDAPTANDDTIEVAGDTEDNRIDVLDNDTQDPDSGETLRVTQISTPSAGGTVRIGTGGTHILYTPEPGFVGTETFTYTLSDGELTDTATVTVTVTESNPPPIAEDDSFTVTEDAAESSFDVLANDSTDDPEETISLDSVISVEQGTARISTDGASLLYQPAANFFGTDRVVYQIRDSNGATAQATATFTVTAVNDPPPAPNRSANVVRGSSEEVVLDVEALSQINVDGPDEPLTITSVGSTSAGGTVQIEGAGARILYTPPTSEFTGTDSFDYTVSDDANLAASGTLTIEVLDFTPRDFTLMLHSPQVGALSSPFGEGFLARLEGTTYNNQAVQSEAPVNTANGMVVFEDQAPGSYQVTVPSLPFLFGENGERVFTIESDAEDTSPPPIEVDFDNLAAQYVLRRDYLSSAPQLAAFVIVAPGQSHSWISASSDPDMPQNVAVSMSQDGEQVTIEIDDPDSNGRVSATLQRDSALLDHRGSEAGYHLFRINVDPEQISYSPVGGGSGGSGDSGGSGEGEGSGLEAEGEPPTAGGVAQNIASPVGTASASSTAPGAAGSFSTTPAATGVEEEPVADAMETVAGVGGWSGSLSGEGEAGPLDTSSQGSGTAIVRGEAANVESPETPVRSSAAVDSAMQDLLPQLEPRSEAGESLASQDDDAQVDALDAMFRDLGENRLG